jgi:hypothetical protein
MIVPTAIGDLVIPEAIQSKLSMLYRGNSGTV